MRIDIENRKNDLLYWVKLNKSKAFMCRELKCKPETLNFWLNKLGIIYNGNQGSKGSKSNSRKSALEYLSSTKHISAHKLRIKLIEDGIKAHACEMCCLKEWNEKPIPLELHHIDGNRYNNSIDNLQILCPNCHSQTDNNSGKNKGKY